MTDTPIRKNSHPHWVLYELAVAEAEGSAPLRRKEILSSLPFEWHTTSVISSFPESVDTARFIHTYRFGRHNNRSYRIADDGIKTLEQLGAPTDHPSHRESPSEPLNLSLPSIETTNIGPLQTLKANLDGDEQTPHLYYVDENGELVAVCSPPSRTQTALRGIQSVTPQEVRDHDDICAICEKRYEVQQWMANAEDEDSPAQSSRQQSLWNRYETDDHTADESDPEFPTELVENGKVYVSRNYTGQREYLRKLHVHKLSDTPVNNYRSGKKTLFDTPCGLARDMPIYDELERIDASSFLRRADACEHCKEQVEEQYDAAANTDAPAKQVGFDPFNVFESESDGMSQEELEAEYLPTDDGEPLSCPDCGREFDSDKGLTLHWSHPKSSCDYPVPSKREREILTALYLTGGAIEGKSTPNMRKTSVNIKMLRWFYDRLGIWASSLRRAATSDEQRKAVSGAFGYEDADSQQQYRLTTRTCPWLEELEATPIEDMRLTPLIGRCLYSVRGYLTDKSIITIRHKNRAVADLLEEAGFEVRAVRTPDEGKNQYKIRLSASASREFADWIGQRILPGYPHKKLEFREAHAHKEGPRPRNPEQDATIVETPPADNPTPDEDSDPAPPDTTPDAPTVEADEGDDPDTDDETEDEPEVIGTVSFEPEWEWVGVQLYKMGMDQFAIRAFNKDFSPAEVYSKGGIADMIYSAAHDPEYDLDIEDRFPGSLTQVEAPVSPDVIESVKQDLGVA